MKLLWLEHKKSGKEPNSCALLSNVLGLQLGL